MQFLTISLALLAGPFSANEFQPAPSKDSLSPPGLVLVEGGRTKIGTSFNDMEKLIEEHKEAQEKAGGFLSEVPQNTIAVDDFFMMVTEVTNEQYREYVLSVNGQPPLLWGDKAIGVARDLFLQEDAEKRRAAKEANQPVPERAVWDAFTWWERNWKDQEWEMPEAIAKHPVIYVDYQNARGYAEWAGLRLPTEFEFERAVRGDTENDFTWGKDWESNAAVTKELRTTSDIMNVGSFPAGASRDGVFDLIGNVWEWTSSKYVAYDGYKHRKFSVGKGRLAMEIDSMPKFSPDRRVVRSGSQQTGYIFARASTRGGFDRDQKASVLGFRCAASTKAGFDFAVSRMDDIPNSARPHDSRGLVTYDPNQVIARDRWISTPGSSDVPGYAVISQYDYILFTPVESMQTNGLGDIRKGALSDEIYHFGFLSTNQDMVEPALRAGTYLVALRGAGKYPERKEPKAGEAETVEAGSTQDDDTEKPEQSTMRVDEFLEIDPLVDNFIFVDMTGVAVAAMPAMKLDYGNPSAGAGAAKVVDRLVTIEIPANDPKNPEAVEEIQVKQQWLELDFFIKGRSRKGAKIELGLRFAEGLMDGDWR